MYPYFLSTSLVIKMKNENQTTYLIITLFLEQISFVAKWTSHHRSPTLSRTWALLNRHNIIIIFTVVVPTDERTSVTQSLMFTYIYILIIYLITIYNMFPNSWRWCRSARLISVSSKIYIILGIYRYTYLPVLRFPG